MGEAITDPLPPDPVYAVYLSVNDRYVDRSTEKSIAIEVFCTSHNPSDHWSIGIYASERNIRMGMNTFMKAHKDCI